MEEYRIAMIDANSKISLIIPVYNVKEYVSKCIESVISQTYKNLEIIIVDDGSTDGSGTICDYYKSIDKRIVVIHKENGGLSSARNSGLKIASGQYIGFIDSDDYIDSTMYEILINSLSNNKADIVCCDYFEFRDNEELFDKIKRRDLIYSKEEAMSHLFDDVGYKCFAWNKLYRKELWDRASFREGKIFEDIEPTFLVFSMANKIVFVQEKLYYYRVRKSSISQSGFYYGNNSIVDLRDALENVWAQFVIDYTNRRKALAGGYASYYLHYISVALCNNEDVSADARKLKKFLLEYKKYVFGAENQYKYKKLQFLFFYCLDYKLYSLIYRLAYRLLK